MNTYDEIYTDMLGKLTERGEEAIEECDRARLEEAKKFLMKQCRFKNGYDRAIYREALNDFIRLVQ